MKKSILFFAVIVICFAHFSCKKDEKESTKTELLTGNTWIIKSKAVSPPAMLGGIVIDDVSILDSDDQRNFTFKYNADGTMLQYNKAQQVIFTSGWSFNADENVITYNPGIVFSYSMVGDVILDTMTIISITKDKLVVEVPYNFAGTVYLATFTYEPK